ncbi:MarR family winged helix-turn-helix transcriptional regulator [Arthrobacter sp. TMN-37]
MNRQDKNEIRLANESWEALLQAETALARRFAADEIWDELSTREYDVLFTLSKADGGLGISELGRRILLSQPGMSKLVTRLEERGLVEKRSNQVDRREARILLTQAGTEAQKRVGRKHARAVADRMTSALSHAQLEQLRDLSRQITAVINPDLLNKPTTERTSS